MEDSHLPPSKNAHPQTDEWIHQIREGNEEAFKNLFLKYYNGLCRFSSSIIRSPFLAEGIVQEVFASIWETREMLDPNGNIKAYLYQSVKNKTFDWLESQKTETKYVNEFKSYKIIEHESSSIQENDRFTYEVQKAINNLPHRARLIFNLHKKEGLTYREIAQVMNISIKTVESQMGRALKIIRLNIAKSLTFFSIAFLIS